MLANCTQWLCRICVYDHALAKLLAAMQKAQNGCGKEESYSEKKIPCQDADVHGPEAANFEAANFEVSDSDVVDIYSIVYGDARLP